MPSHTHPGPVNLGQLSVAMGRVPLRMICDAAGACTVSSDGLEADLVLALEAHVADPDWTDPEAPPPPPTLEEAVAALPNPAVDLEGFRSGLIDLLAR